MSRSGREPYQMSGCGREALPDVRELSRELPGWPGVVGGPYKYLGVVGRSSRMFGSGRESLPNIQDGWEALPNVWEW